MILFFLSLPLCRRASSGGEVFFGRCGKNISAEHEFFCFCLYAFHILRYNNKHGFCIKESHFIIFDPKGERILC